MEIKDPHLSASLQESLRNSPAAQSAFRHLTRLKNEGFEAYWVGGCVRDLLMGLRPKDYDIATNANPNEVERLFPNTIPVGKQFGVILVMDSGIQTEIATFRVDEGYSDGRRPDAIRFCSAREDAIRRDFTINGIFLDPIQEKAMDWVGGLEDLRLKKIRAIGAAASRFAEDHLRMLRAIRFAQRYQFEIEATTLQAIQTHAQTIQQVSPERIRAELIRLLTPPDLDKAAGLLERSGLFQYIFPDWTCPLPDIVTRGLRLIRPQAERVEVWATICRLFEVLGWPALQSEERPDAPHRRCRSKAENLLRFYTFPCEELNPILSALEIQHRIQQTDPFKTLAARRLMSEKWFPLAWEVFQVVEQVAPEKKEKRLNQWSQAWQEFKKHPEWEQPLILGRDIIKSGMRPGPRVGEILDQIRDLQLLGELNSRQEAMDYALDLIKAESLG